jgi:4-hydroxy-tetrahydrodipicolinate synthase
MPLPRFDGVNASVPIPLNGDQTPNLSRFENYLNWLQEQGVIGITVNADTGEGASLSIDERVAVVRTARSTLRREISVFSGLMAASTRQAVEVGKALVGAGADALLVFNPPAFVGNPLPGPVVMRYFESVKEIGVPLVAFNLSSDLGGVVLPPQILTDLANAELIIAVKDASFDSQLFIASRNALRVARQKVVLLSGCDNFIYESLVLGADGCLLGFSSLAPAATVELANLVMQNRLAEADRLDRTVIAPLAAAMFALPMRDSRARIKAGLVKLGLFETATVREPLLPLSVEAEAAMLAAIDLTGLV